MMVSPVVVMHVAEPVLLSRLIFFFCIPVDVNRHWPLILL